METGLHFSIRVSMFEIRVLRSVLRLTGNDKAREIFQKFCFTLCALHKASRTDSVTLMGRNSTKFGFGKVTGRGHFEYLGTERRVNSKINNLDSSDTGYGPVASSSK
jgi:hypothetical protein